MEKLHKHKSTIILGIILLLASFLRLYKIGDYLTFLGDEGRDVLVALHMLQGDITFLGPRASAGDFFLGPIYYYFITPFLWLFNYDPVGPAVMVALFGIATVYLVYKVGKEFFGTNAGLIAAALFSVSPLVLRFSRSSWNPNLMPFVSLLILYLTYKGIKKPSWKLFGFIGILYGIAMQLHYIELFLGVILFLFLIVGTWIENRQHYFQKIIQQSLLMLLGFIVSLLPFIAFEVKNGFPNIRTIFSFIFSSNAESTYLNDGSFMTTAFDVFVRVFGNLLTRFPSFLEREQYPTLLIDFWTLGIVLTALFSIFILFKTKDRLVVLFFSLWLFFGIVLFGFYKKEIYDYYFAFMFPLPFLLVGNLLSRPFNYKKMIPLKLLSGTLFLVIFVYSLLGMPFLKEPNRMKEQARTIADFVLDKTNDEPFNFALLADSNSDHAYRYFFEIKNRAPITIENDENDPSRTTVTDQLFVVCENPPCKPLGHPIYEIAGYGQAKIVEEWDVSVVKVYKLEKIKRDDSTEQ